jgi:hypothetical protein
MRKLDHMGVRHLIREEVLREERRRLDEGWLEILGDVGMQVLNSSAGRKMAAKALHGLAAIVLIPSKMDEQEAAKKSKVLGTIVSIGKSVGGLTQLATALEAVAKMLENMSDEEAQQVAGAAQSLKKGMSGSQ